MCNYFPSVWWADLGIYHELLLFPLSLRLSRTSWRMWLSTLLCLHWKYSDLRPSLW